MKHVVLGNGNLAQSLIQEIKSKKETIVHHHRKSGFSYPDCYEQLIKNDALGISGNPNEWFVWNTIGAGSIPEADERFSLAISAHLGLVADLDQKLPDGVTTINFSTDYVVSPHDHVDTRSVGDLGLSLYAYSKLMMEQYIKFYSKRKTHCIRVANLYGIHRPEKTLPYKLLQNIDKIDTLPENIITPTPTEWLSKMLLSINWKDVGLEGEKIHHLAPFFSITIREFGELIFNKRLDSNGYDLTRPLGVNLGNDFGFQDTVLDCWENSEFKLKYRNI